MSEFDEFIALMTAWTKAMEPIIVRAAEHYLISPAEQAELATIQAAVTAWYIRMLNLVGDS